MKQTIAWIFSILAVLATAIREYIHNGIAGVALFFAFVLGVIVLVLFFYWLATRKT